MPNKKGSKVAAGRARAQATAKKKARSTGPTLPAAAFVKPNDATVLDGKPNEALNENVEGAIEGTGEKVSVAEAPAAVTAAPRRTPRLASSRRHRQGGNSLPMHSLGREVVTVGIITATISVVLGVLKFVTDFGV